MSKKTTNIELSSGEKLTVHVGDDWRDAFIDVNLPKDADAEAAEKWLRKLVRSIGFGFHPDTPGKDYVGPEAQRFSDAQCKALDESVERLFALLGDPYEIAADEMSIMI
jgi:hypothetical protein